MLLQKWNVLNLDDSAEQYVGYNACNAKINFWRILELAKDVSLLP